MSRTPHVLCFRGPVHHGQLMRPVEEALRARGAHISYWTTDTEGCFQIDLAAELGADGYHWLPDYWDEREAGALYHSHADWLRERFLEPNVLSYTMPQIVDRVVRTICHEWVGLRRLLGKLRPTHCLALHEINRWGVMMGALATKLGIPYATLQEGLYYNHPMFYTGATRYSHAYIWGEGTKRVLLNAGCDDARLHVVGHPDLGARFAQGAASRALLDAELPPQAKGKKLALIFFSHMTIDATIPAAIVWQGLAASDWFIVGRQHQLASVPQMEQLQALFAAASAEHAWLSPSTLPLAHHWRLMAAAEVLLVIGCSSMTAEWAWSGKPMGRVPTGNLLRDFGAEGVMVACDTQPLPIALEYTVAQWQAHQARAAAFVKDELAAVDVAGAIADAILAQR